MMHAFTPTTLPTKKDEAYKYTDLAALLRGVTPVYLNGAKTCAATGDIAIQTDDHNVTHITIPAQGTAHIFDDIVTDDGVWADRRVHVHVGLGARLEYVRMISGRGSLTDRVVLSVDPNASVDITHLQAGAHLVRTDLIVDLGDAANFNLRAVQIAGADEHADLTVLVTHTKPNATSVQTVRNVIGAGGRGVFQGKILVAPGAQKTSAHQLSQTLLMAPSAEMNTKPELEIYADDVACAHGATTGALDETQIFYLMSRGLSRTQACALLTEGFITAQFDGLNDAPRARLVHHAIAALEGLSS